MWRNWGGKERLGGSVGVCCQKCRGRGCFARGVSKDWVRHVNQVVILAKIAVWPRIPKTGARAICLRR